MDFDSSWRKQNKYCLREASCQLHFKTLDVHNSCGYAAKDILQIPHIYSFSETGKAIVSSCSLFPYTDIKVVAF